jgi:hypothetical protein
MAQAASIKYLYIRLDRSAQQREAVLRPHADNLGIVLSKILIADVFEDVQPVSAAACNTIRKGAIAAIALGCGMDPAKGHGGGFLRSTHSHFCRAMLRIGTVVTTSLLSPYKLVSRSFAMTRS